MYGYVVINQPELKFKEYDIYRSYYCGLCHVLKEKYSLKGQMSISYDMTFLVMLLTGLYEPDITYIEEKCVAHPIRKHQTRFSYITDYVADMNILMTYYKCIDDWQDEKKVTRKVVSDLLKKSAHKVMEKYPEKAKIISDNMSALSEAEKRLETNIDTVANCFGNVLGCIFAMKDDEWKDTLYNIGYSLGKYIYILDAYEDLDKDIKGNQYNVLISHRQASDFDEMCQTVLNAIMAQCAKNFEMLPIIQDVQILRNLLYSGVWTRFQAARQKKEQESVK